MTPAEKKKWTAARRDFVCGGPCCVCGGLPHDVHEILAGANRQAAFVERATWLRVCRECHNLVQGADPHWQLALKLLSDPCGFDLKAFCKAWGRENTAVEAGTILHELQQELSRRG